MSFIDDVVAQAKIAQQNLPANSLEAVISKYLDSREIEEAKRLANLAKKGDVGAVVEAVVDQASVNAFLVGLTTDQLINNTFNNRVALVANMQLLKSIWGSGFVINTALIDSAMSIFNGQAMVNASSMINGFQFIMDVNSSNPEAADLARVISMALSESSFSLSPATDAILAAELASGSTEGLKSLLFVLATSKNGFRAASLPKLIGFAHSALAKSDAEYAINEANPMEQRLISTLQVTRSLIGRTDLMTKCDHLISMISSIDAGDLVIAEGHLLNFLSGYGGAFSTHLGLTPL